MRTHTSPKRRGWLLLSLLSVLTFWSAQAAADYPEKPVRLVVPFPPGGSFDGPARLLATRLTTLSGKPFVVDTRAGVGGALGAAEVSRAAPDGYTVLLSNGAMPVSAALSKKPLFDAVAGFSHVATFGVLPFAIVVNGKAPFDNLQDFIAASKAAPGKYNYASAGNGSASHLSAELVKEAFGIDWVHVPYRGSGPAMTDLMAGQVTVSVPGLSSAVGQVKAGTLKALAVTGATRSPQMPNVPTLAELKPGLVLETWVGISAPPKTPPQIIARLASLIEQAMKDPELQAQLVAQGVTPVYERPVEISARMAKEVEMFSALGKRANISMD
ncbi:MAG: tripartite tricarboxylate transporter substrate binding protein [Polaromonas sp.]|nr:tripartite tricarboxylate transporter substrate binding protein [Polaromonas sp.]